MIFFCFKFDCLKKWIFVELGIIRNFKLVFFFFRYLLVLNFLFLRGYNVLEVRWMWVMMWEVRLIIGFKEWI